MSMSIKKKLHHKKEKRHHKKEKRHEKKHRHEKEQKHHEKQKNYHEKQNNHHEKQSCPFVVENLKVCHDANIKHNLKVCHNANIQHNLKVGNDVKIKDDLEVGDNITVGNNINVLKDGKEVTVDAEITRIGNVRLRVDGRLRVNDNVELRRKLEVSSLISALNDIEACGSIKGKNLNASQGISSCSVSAKDYILLSNYCITVDDVTNTLNLVKADTSLSPTQFLSLPQAASTLPIIRLKFPVNQYTILRQNNGPGTVEGGRYPGTMTVSSREPKDTFVKQTEMNCSNSEYSGNMAVQLRGGNSTNLPKRSWNIEMRSEKNIDRDRHFSLLDYPEEADWWIKADFVDSSYLRNHVSLWMQNLVQKSYNQWSPVYKYCELIIDDKDDIGADRTTYGGVVGLVERIKRDSSRLDLNVMEGVIFEIRRADEIQTPNPLLGQPSLGEPGGLEFARKNDVANFWSERGLWGLKLSDVVDADINPPTFYKAPEAANIYQFSFPSVNDTYSTRSILSDEETVRREFYIKRIKDMENALAPFVTMSNAEAQSAGLFAIMDTYFDLDSLIDCYIINEIFYTGDTLIERGIYCKDFKSKFMFVAWDFDQTSGNYNYSLDGTPYDPNPQPPTYNTRIFQGFTLEQKNKRGPMGVHSFPFWFDLIPKTSELRAKIHERWTLLKDVVQTSVGGGNFFDSVNTYLDNTMNLIRESAERDFQEWPDRSYTPMTSNYIDKVTSEAVIVGDRIQIIQEWEPQAVWFKEWLINRITYIDIYWNSVANVDSWAAALMPAPTNPLELYKEILTFTLKATTSIGNIIVSDGNALGGYSKVIQDLLLLPFPNPVDFIIRWATALVQDNNTPNPSVGVSGLWYGPAVTNSFPNYRAFSLINDDSNQPPYPALILQNEVYSVSPNISGNYDQIGCKIKILKDVIIKSKPYFTSSLKENLYVGTIVCRSADIEQQLSISLKFGLLSFISNSTNIFKEVFGIDGLDTENAIAGSLQTNIGRQYIEFGGNFSLFTPNFGIQVNMVDGIQSLDDGAGVMRDYMVFDTKLTRTMQYPVPALNNVSPYPTPGELSASYDNNLFVKGETYSVVSLLINISPSFQNGFFVKSAVGPWGVQFAGVKNITIPL